MTGPESGARGPDIGLARGRPTRHPLEPRRAGASPRRRLVQRDICRRQILMSRNGILPVVLLGLCVPTDAADQGEAVGGTRYPAAITGRIGGKPVKLVLTGTALRTRWGFGVYTIGSYIQEGVAVRDAGSLARAVVPKQLHLVFERAVDGATLAQSFRDSIALNYPEPAFAVESAELARYLASRPVKKGDHVWLTFIP